MMPFIGTQRALVGEIIKKFERKVCQPLLCLSISRCLYTHTAGVVSLLYDITALSRDVVTHIYIISACFYVYPLVLL